MFKRLLILGSFAFCPVVAMAGGTSLDEAVMRTMSAPTGQGAWLRITIPSHSNFQELAQAPYALTGGSPSDTPHHYLQVDIGQGGWVRVQTD